MKTNHASTCNSPIQLVLLNVHSKELNVVQVIGEQIDRVQTIHVCRCHLGRDATLRPLVGPVQFASKHVQVKVVGQHVSCFFCVHEWAGPCRAIEKAQWKWGRLAVKWSLPTCRVHSDANRTAGASWRAVICDESFSVLKLPSQLQNLPQHKPVQLLFPWGFFCP